jgi:hypothetical protein
MDPAEHARLAIKRRIERERVEGGSEQTRPYVDLRSESEAAKQAAKLRRSVFLNSKLNVILR